MYIYIYIYIYEEGPSGFGHQRARVEKLRGASLDWREGSDGHRGRPKQDLERPGLPSDDYQNPRRSLLQHFNTKPMQQHATQHHQTTPTASLSCPSPSCLPIFSTSERWTYYSSFFAIPLVLFTSERGGRKIEIRAPAGLGRGVCNPGHERLGCKGVSPGLSPPIDKAQAETPPVCVQPEPKTSHLAIETRISVNRMAPRDYVKVLKPPY